MEVVAGTASVAALAELAIKSHSYAARLVKSFYNAPKELCRVLQHLEILRCELALLSDIEKRVATDDELPLLSEESSQIEGTLATAFEFMSDIQRRLDIAQTRTGVKARFKWALKNKQQTEEQLDALKHIESSLHTVLLLINIRLSSYTWKVALSLRGQGAISSEVENLPSQAENVEFVCPKRSLSLLFDRNPHAWNNFYGSWGSYDHPLISWLGLHISLVSYGSSLHTTLFLSGRVNLWKWLTSRTLSLNVGLRVFPLANLGFSVLRGSLLTRNVVSETSEVMVSCARGDLSAVKSLFSSRKASPYDITYSNSPPIRYAIESGSLELVQFLCHNGADVNDSFGVFQTSPLEWAFKNRQLEISRFLLSQGARLDYLCFRGWTPVMLLFWPASIIVPAEYFHMLCANSFSDFDVQDRFGLTALHRAAAWGTAEDIGMLLKVGASPLLTDHQNGWTPIFQAASANNIATLMKLAENMPPEFIHNLDAKGQTILHVAIETGGVEVMRCILEFGADPHRTLWVEDQDSIIRREVTPLEFARIKGPKPYETFIQALHLAGLDISTMDDDAGTVFWLAEDHTVKS